MEAGIYDRVVDELLKRRELLRGELRTRFKNTKPLRSEPIENDELLVYYNQMANDWNYEAFVEALIQRHGREKVSDFIRDMEQSKLRRGIK